MNFFKNIWNWITNKDIVNKEQFDNFCDKLKGSFDEIDENKNKALSPREICRFVRKTLKKVIKGE